MNSLSIITPAERLQSDRATRARLLHDTFEAWRVYADNGRNVGAPIDISATTLTGAAEQACARCDPKQPFIIRQTDPAGNATLHFYRVKRSTKLFTTRESYDGGRPVREGKKVPDHLFTLAVEAFEPAGPWRWMPGCDVVGIDRGLVENGHG